MKKNYLKKLVLLVAIVLAGITSKAQVTVVATAATMGPTVYPNLNAAFTAINAGTHQGVIGIGILASTVEAGACVLNASGAGPAIYTSVTIQPVVDGVSIAGPTTTGRGLIELNGADNVLIDGDNPNTAGTNRNLSIINTATNSVTFTSCVRIALSTLINNADNVTIRNCNLTGSGTGRNVLAATTETTTWGVVLSGGASTAAATTAPSALSSATTTVASPLTATNLIIDNNNIQTVSRGVAINGSSTTVATGLKIRGNIIGNATVGNADQVWAFGITAQGSSDGVISGNTVRVESFIAASSAGRGIDLGTVSTTVGTFTVENNTIERVVNNEPQTWNAYGLNINGGTNHNIRNNFIYGIANNQVAGTGAFSTTFGAFAIRIAGGTGLKINNNTVHLTGVMPGSTSTNLVTCLGFITTSVTGCDVRNNVFSNQMTGGNPATFQTTFSCIYFPTGATSAMNLTWNNNVYYQGPLAYSVIGQVGVTAGTGFYSAANFNPAVTTPATNLRSYTSPLSAANTNDNASFASSVAPPLISATNLHVNLAALNNLDLDAKAVVIPGLTLDIDGNTRDITTPDIGADEFVTTNCVGANGGTISPSTVTTCAGQTLVMSSTGATIGSGISYQWKVGTSSGGPYSNVVGGSGATTTSYTTAALSAGTFYYVLQTTCSNGPLTGLSNELTVTVNTLPNVAVSPTAATYCSPGVPVTLTASGAVAYAWGPAAGLSAVTGTSVDASPSASTTYTVVGTSANGCVASATTTITSSARPTGVTAGSSAPAVCAGGSIDLTSTATSPVNAVAEDFNASAPSWTITNGPSSPPACSWNYPAAPFSEASGSLTFTNFSTVNGGRFAHTNADWGGSGSTTNTVLTSPAFSTVGMTSASLTFEHIYRKWASGDVTVAVEVSTDGGGTWSVLKNYIPLGDQGSTADNAQVPVNENISLAAYLNQSNMKIRFNYVSVWGYFWVVDNVMVSGPVVYSYNWTSAPVGFTSTTQNPTGVMPAATTTYSVTITNSSGCSSSATVGVTVNPLPTVSASSMPNPACAGDMVTLSGGGAVSYTWTGGQMDNVPFTAVSTDTYTVTGTDANGCQNTDMTTLTVNPLPSVVANSTATVTCSGDPVTLTGSGATSYTWTSSVMDNVAFNPTATDTYTVTGIDVNGCTNTDNITVTVNALPTVVANSTATTVCDGSPVTLNGSGATSYTWTGSVTDNVAFNPTSTDTYTVTGTDGNGCMNTDMITVTVNALPTVVANATATAVCDGSPVTLSGSGATTYTWTGSVTDNVAFTPLVSDTYTVTGTDGNGCTNTDMITVTVNPNPTVTVSFPMDTVCFNGGNVNLTGESPAGGAWSGTGVSGSSFDPQVAGLGWEAITYMYTDANGCSGMLTDSLNVDVCNGIAALVSVSNVTVYPNPNMGQFTIQLTNVPQNAVQVELTNSLGQLIDSFMMTTTSKQIDISTLEGGVYMLRVIDGNNISVHRVVKQ